MIKCSHIVCKVNNIANVVRDYEALGFSMEWGSAPERAYNAMLWFEEGPFIEFYRPPKLFTYLRLPIGLVFGKAIGKRLAYYSRFSEGWCDVALEPADKNNENEQEAEMQNIQDLKAIKSAINKAGISTSRIINRKRTRPDKLKVKCSLFIPNSVGLPFVTSGYDSPQRPEKIEHPNGATGIESVKMGVAENDLSQFQTLCKGDKFLKVESSPQTRALEVGLSGLGKKLDSRYLHGATFFTAPKNQ